MSKYRCNILYPICSITKKSVSYTHLDVYKRQVIDSLKFHFHCQYDEKDSIGKRYRRQDAIGTPYCVTVDHQTLEDNCVTLRNRDTMQQERVAISELNNIIADRVSITSLLKTLQ